MFVGSITLSLSHSLSPCCTGAPGMEPLTYHEDNRTFTCVSTGSPATTVSWMKDGNNITIDGNQYSFSQTIIDRTSSTYRNVLRADAPGGVAGVYNCTVTNVLGSNSTSVVAVGELIH